LKSVGPVETRKPQKQTQKQSVGSNNDLPQEWTQKISSEEFLRGWHTKTDSKVEARTEFPPDVEERKSERKTAIEISVKQALLSKFLTNAAQPKVESKSPLSKPD